MLGALAFFALSQGSGPGAAQNPLATTPATATSSSTPRTNATAVVAPPAVTSSAPSQPISGNGRDHGKKKGK